jgi:hypothetical protein
LRVIHRGSHQPFGERRVQHAMLGSFDWRSMKAHVADRNTLWATALAARIAQIEAPCPPVQPRHPLHPLCTTDRAANGTDSPLFSWVIAPPARV